ncbi:MAG: hypothetical protein IPP64_11940 [Bacteroidetes bacterium]|nr:hypothetical protein [Bacteroidota bacterium]
MIKFEDYKKIAVEPKDIELFKQYEEYRKQWFQEEQKIFEAKAAFKEKQTAFWFEFLKYFFGTIIIGAFTAYTTFIFKNYELKLQTRKQDSETIAPYVKQFVELMEKDSMKYNRVHAMCEFLSYTIIEDSLKSGFASLRDLYQTRIDNAKANVINTSDSLTVVVKNVDSLKSELYSENNVKSVKDLDKIKTQIKLLESQAEQLSIKKVEAITFAKEKLENTTNLNIPISSNADKYTLIYDEERYTGPGWYSQMSENFSIYMNEVNVKDNSVQYDLKFNEKIVSSVTQKVGDIKKISTEYDNYRITIFLTGITKRKAFYRIKIERSEVPTF